MQSKLLRVLEEKTVTRIGASKLIDVDVRIIAATNKNLLELVEAKEFREDLYYRINVLPLYIPPLRERIDDLRPLMNTFMDSMGKKMIFSDEAAKRLLAHRWKGNVRELKNVIEYLDSLGKRLIEKEDLPASILCGACTENICCQYKTSRKGGPRRRLSRRGLWLVER